jgi:hypothetical protein
VITLIFEFYYDGSKRGREIFDQSLFQIIIGCVLLSLITALFLGSLTIGYIRYDKIYQRSVFGWIKEGLNRRH